MRFLSYMIMSSVCISIFYMAYRLIFRKDTNFGHARMFILLSLILSLSLPLINLKIDTDIQWYKKKTPRTEVINPASILAMATERPTGDPRLLDRIRNADPIMVVFRLYQIVACLLLLRILIQIIILAVQYFRSDKIHRSDCVLLYNHRFRNTFSFFRWIFVHRNLTLDDELEQIITHERIHANQYHSFDLILIELLAAAMWFNPVIWMMKKSIQLVHEYLADEGAIGTGIDKLQYQALLINQVTEERLICLSSSFNHSLIKKRMIMMTKNNITQRTRFKLLVILPLSASLLFMIAVFNGIFTGKVQAADPVQQEISPFNNAEPPDTVIKKTIIKSVSKDNPQDTIVEESEDIIIHMDSKHEDEFIWHEDHGDKKTVIVHVNGDGKSVVEHGDSVKVIKIITKGGGKVGDQGVSHSNHVSQSNQVSHENKVSHSKQVYVYHTSDDQSSRTLFVIDGVAHPEKDAIKELDPDQINSVDVINKPEEMKKYTSEDYDAVIVIKTKKK